MLNKTEEPGTLRLIVVFLRFHARMTQAELGKAASVEQALISRYESGQQPPPEETVKRMARVAGIPWSLVMYLRRVYSAILRLSQRQGTAAGFAAESLEGLLDRMLVALAPYLTEMISGLVSGETPEQMRREAEKVWTSLKDLPMGRRRRMLELSVEAAKSWAMAERLCEASLEAVGSDPEEALGLADLALGIARQVEGEEPWRSRLQGYCWAHIAHARRAVKDAAGAEAAAARAWELWDEGSFAGGGLLSAARMFELLGEEDGKWHVS
ncbi:MAG TPA: helix-turn-helix transcriptional regulator [Thermoanaerobaculia bacterium]|nr:helix-turn-helix transcriptional regulator [Thermoanaerobaculia bacterium]